MRPFHGFLNFWLEPVSENSWMVNMAANFDQDLLKTTEDIFPQSRRILQTFVWWGVGKFVPPPSPSSPHKRL